MSSESDLIKLFRQSYNQMIENADLSGLEPMFKPTPRATIAITELEIPDSKRTFKELIESLHILLNEGSGNGTRLPQKLDEKRIAHKIRRLRNYYFHDPNHGTIAEQRRKHKETATIFKELIGTETPYSKEHWHELGVQIILHACNFLGILIEKYPNYKGQYGIIERQFKHYYEHNITLFPDKRVPYIIIKKKASLSHLSSAPIFTPHTSYMLTPEFGYNSNNAIHFSSSCYDASLEDYGKFLKRIGELWERNLDFVARSTRDLYPWSISSNGEMKYGSGFDNLIEAVKNTEIGIVSILLAGCYGEDYSKTFYLVISNYWKYDIFRDNQLDIYLSNMPLDYRWVCEFNDSLKILSESADIAESYSLKPIISRRWRSENQFDIRGKVIGGIGRDGHDDKRGWDMFDGIILENPFSKGDFELEDHFSLVDMDEFECPVEAFDIIVMSVTNSPPDYDDIISGRFKGVSRPTIDHQILDGGGCEIHSILFWGWSITDD